MAKKVFFVLVVFVCLLFGGCSAVQTKVNSISYRHGHINPSKSFHVLPSDNSFASKKILKIIKKELKKKGYKKFTTMEKAEVVVSFSTKFLGSKTKLGIIKKSIQTPVYNPITGLTIFQTIGQLSDSYSLSSHQTGITIQFYDGEKLRRNETNSILWESIGKSIDLSGDIVLVAPKIISRMFEKIGKYVNS